MQEILAPLDGTGAAESALPWVSCAARRSGAGVTLFSVVPLDASSAEMAERESYLSAHQQSLEGQGLRAGIELAGGDAAQRITARARRADLTVMTSGTVRWVVSAVLDRVLQDVEGPIIVVRTAPGQVRVPPDPDRILVPLDSSSYSGQVLPVVTSLATALGSSVVLCHIVPSLGGYRDATEAPPGIAKTMEQWLGDPTEYILNAATSLRAAGITVETVTEPGDPAQKIPRLAESGGAGLIAMATRGRDSLGQRVTGSVANQVLESTGIPCLLLRQRVPAPTAPDIDGDRVPA